MKIQDWLREMYFRLDNDLDKTLEKLKERYGIESKVYDDSIVLNYNLILANYPNDEIVRECRALQLDRRDFFVMSRAFRRFLNYGEGDTRESFVFDKETVVYDKIDGSLVILYWHPYRKRWEVRTRKTAYAEAPVISEGEVCVKDFRSLILLALGVKNLDFLEEWGLNKEKSYVFELVSPENRVITPYRYREMYYLSTFDNESGEESGYEDGYKYIHKFLDCKKVDSYGYGDINTVLEMAKRLAPAEEGYVVRNGQNDRVKVKNPAYLALSLLHNGGQMTERRVLELVEIGEDSEYLAYFPEEKEKFERIKEKKRKLRKDCEDVYEKIKEIEEQKEFALEAQKYPYSGILFKMRTGKSMEDVWRESSIGYKCRLLGVKP